MKTTKRKVLFLITLGVMMIYKAGAQDPVFDWVAQMGGTGLDHGRSIAIDINGDVVTTGGISGEVTWTLGNSSFNLTANGTTDVFILKTGQDGSPIWAKHCGGSGTATGKKVITDDAGNIIVTGNFSGTVDFDPGPGTFNMINNGNAYVGTATFVLKLDPDGNFLWAKQTEPINGGTVVYSMVRDVDGNLILTGNVGGEVDFDPGPGTTTLSPGANYQVFTWKLDSEGNFLWVKELGAKNLKDYGYSVVSDANGNIYTTGSFYRNVDFDPSKKGRFIMHSNGINDGFIQKLDQNGNFVWAKQIGGTGSDGCQSTTRDAFGNLYTAGYFSGTVDFDPGPGTFNLTTTGAATSSAFIQKLDAAGNFVWAVQVEGTGTDHDWSGTWSIHADAGGNVYTTGYFGGSADFDPGLNIYEKTCIDTVDYYALKLDGSGNFKWALQIGGENGFNCGLGINSDIYGNVYTTGFFTDVASGFDPANPGFQLLSNGYRDYFLLKMNQEMECVQPLNLNVTDISYYSATLNWNAVAGAGSYNVRYRATGSANWITSYNVYETDLPLYGLSLATVYEFQVQTDCGEESTSDFSTSATFTTLGSECTDVYEPNQTQGAANTIPVNTDVEALINVATDTDWFKFNNARKKNNIKITLTNLPDNYDVALYHADGTLLGISENTGTDEEIITYNTSIIGTYYINVYGSDGAYDPLLCYTLNASIKKPRWKSAAIGTNEDEVAMDFSVYPNPARTILNILFNSPADENITLRFIDMNGKTFSTYNFKAVEGVNKYTINLDDFSNGLYFIDLTEGKNRIFRKVIINK